MTPCTIPSAHIKLMCSLVEIYQCQRFVEVGSNLVVIVRGKKGKQIFHTKKNKYLGKKKEGKMVKAGVSLAAIPEGNFSCFPISTINSWCQSTTGFKYIPPPPPTPFPVLFCTSTFPETYIPGHTYTPSGGLIKTMTDHAQEEGCNTELNYTPHHSEQQRGPK